MRGRQLLHMDESSIPWSGTQALCNQAGAGGCIPRRPKRGYLHLLHSCTTVSLVVATVDALNAPLSSGVLPRPADIRFMRLLRRELSGLASGFLDGAAGGGGAGGSLGTVRSLMGTAAC